MEKKTETRTINPVLASLLLALAALAIRFLLNELFSKSFGTAGLRDLTGFLLINYLTAYFALAFSFWIYFTAILKLKGARSYVSRVLIPFVFAVILTGLLYLLYYKGVILSILGNNPSAAAYKAVPYLLTFLVFLIAALIAIRIGPKPKEDSSTEAGSAAGSTKGFQINEEMSQKAQYTYSKLLASMQESSLVVDEVTEAKLFAQAVETQLLKSPASAVFADLPEVTTVPLGDGGYLVSGHVDSQNSYGALIRSTYTITVVKQNGEWKNADRFISAEASVRSKVISSTIVYWILGLIGTAVLYFIIQMIMDF